MNLHEPLPSIIDWKGKRIRLTLFFDSVVRMSRALENEELDEVARYRMALLCIVDKRDVRKIKRESIDGVAQLLKEIIEGYTTIPSRKGQKADPLFDFEQDVIYIVSAFRQAYGIDLYAEQGKLDWRVFLSLLSGLPDNTMFSKICSIRSMEVPAPTKYNGKEIDSVLKAKTFWRLRGKNESEDEQEFQHGIDKLAETLIAMAKAV